MSAYIHDLIKQFTDPYLAIAQLIGFIPVILGYQPSLFHAL